MTIKSFLPGLALIGLFLSVTLTATSVVSPGRPDNVAPQVWEATSDGGEVEFHLVHDVTE